MLNYRLAEAALSQLVNSIGHWVKIMEAAATAASKLDALAPAERFVDYVPPPRASVKYAKFKGSSLPAPIQACHAWSFSLFDHRRKTVYQQGSKTKITGVVCRARYIPDESLEVAKVGGGRAAPLQILLPGEKDEDAPPEAPEEDEEELPETSNDIHHLSKTVNGWRTSYRSDEAEVVTPEKFRKRLRFKYDKMETIHRRIAEGKRTRSVPEMLSASDKAAVKVKAERERMAYARALDTEASTHEVLSTEA